METKQILIEHTNHYTGKSRCGKSYLYKYSFIHTDLIPEKQYIHFYKCLICLKEVKYGHLRKHLKSKHYDFLLKKDYLFKQKYKDSSRYVLRSKTTLELFEEDSKLDKIIEQEKTLKVDLGMFRCVCSFKTGVYEVIINDERLAYEILECNNITKLMKIMEVNKERLTETMEEFENKIKTTYDKYLGTPKERIEI